MDSEELKFRIDNLKNDIMNRIAKEYLYLNSKGSPNEDPEEELIRNLRWECPELASFIKKGFERLKKD